MTSSSVADRVGAWSESISITRSHGCSRIMRRCSSTANDRSFSVSTYERGICVDRVPDPHRLGERPDRLRAAAGDRPGGLLPGAAAVNGFARHLVGEPGGGRVALDDHVRLDHVARPLGVAGQVEQALAVPGHERADEDQRPHQLGGVRSHLRDDDAAHAGADEDGGLSLRREHLADALGVALQRDFADRRLVGAASRQIERLDGVPACLERPDDRFPCPCAGERAVTSTNRAMTWAPSHARVLRSPPNVT